MIEIGEYVRTKKGIIDKIKTINKYGVITKYDDKEDKISIVENYYINNGLEVNEDDIVKHSKNIIDLIEVGDIVHTRDVLNEDIVYIWSEEYLKALKEDLNNGIELVDILTFEQYTKNCYTVEREKDERNWN